MIPTPTNQIGDCSLYLSENLAILRQMPSNSLEACVTDPPSGTGFMGKEWDDFGRIIHNKVRSADPEKNTKGLLAGYGRGGSPEDRVSHTRRSREAFIPWLTEIMAEVYRVLKPGAHALVWALPRTSHWTAMACEDAGFEIRDSILHLFSSGYPKSQNISKAIDQEFGVEREVIGTTRAGIGRNSRGGAEFVSYTAIEAEKQVPVTAPATDAAKQWNGWGSALSPSHETWWLCRKPLSESTLAKNVLKWGVGGLNVDGCRIPSTGESRSRDGESSAEQRYTTNGSTNFAAKPGFRGGDPLGRFPKNTILDGSDTVAAQFPQAPGQQGAVTGTEPTGTGFSGKVYGAMDGTRRPSQPRGDTGSASRYFYAAKASKADRGEYNTHATVKNTALMQYLIRLITPAGGTILDPFAGSGSTGKAALLEGKKFLGIEREPEYYAIMKRRLQEAAAQPLLFP